MAKSTSDRVSSIASATYDTGKAAVKKVRSLAGSVLGTSKPKKVTKARATKRKAKPRKAAKRAKR